jgi:hypothetical protein
MMHGRNEDACLILVAINPNNSIQLLNTSIIAKHKFVLLLILAVLGNQRISPDFSIVFSPPYQPFHFYVVLPLFAHIRSGGFTTSVRDGICP